ncbi:DNA primase/polymerase [Microbacterium phage Musetta]|nr:DNA primase/polymerase [Microbacterium phage Fork]AXH50226.1 DNA primase/polymerase [Microbacterium phage Musetta]
MGSSPTRFAMTTSTERGAVEYNVDPFKLIEQGISTFPTDPGDKRPVARDPRKHPVPPRKCDCDGESCAHHPSVARISWSKDMTTDPAQIERWVREYPGCRWAAPTGDVNGFFAVDIDSQEADDWWEEKWFPEGSEVPSPSGGRHVRYSMELGENIQTNKSKVYPGIDIRGEGGYIVAYTDDFSDIPAATEEILEIIPRRKTYDDRKEKAAEQANEYAVQAEDAEVDAQEPSDKPSEVSLAEQRVLKGISDALDALPRPWKPGAGYHDVQFRSACHLWRIVNNTRDYATTEDEAYALFVKHAPLRDKHDHVLRDERWRSAKHHATGQVADPPGDTPVRLEVTDELVSKFADSEIDKLFWESRKIGEVKKLIRELRVKGATEQEAYSISYDSAAMKRMRKAGMGSSTWGFVKAEYEEPVPVKAEGLDEEWGDDEPVVKKKAGLSFGRAALPLVLLEDDERDIVRKYPNYIDNYIDAAKKFYAKPNLPLHYVNAWISLSVGIGDKASILLESGRVPLSLWGFNLAPSAAGKSDANAHMHNSVDAMRAGGFAGVDVGDDASAQSLIEVIMERPGKSIGVFMDECREFLTASKKMGSYQELLMGTCLRLYDGEAKRALRKGMEEEKVGEKTETSFTLWMQGAWKRVIEILDESDIESGFVGRFLVAIGGDAEVTRESLTLKIASEYQVENGGRHPLIDSYAVPVRQAVARLEPKSRIEFANQEVLERYVDMREKMEAYASQHRLSESIRGVLLRVGMNVAKGAALLALSEGRTRIEMEDMLLAMKSGEYWVKGSVELAEAISASRYRRLVDDILLLVQSRPRTTAAILRAPKFQNMKKFEVDEIIERAEKEGRIRRSSTGVWEAME